jgi:hypothetical protein
MDMSALPVYIVNDEVFEEEWNIHVEVLAIDCRPIDFDGHKLWNIKREGIITYSRKDNPEKSVSITTPSRDFFWDTEKVYNWLEKHGFPMSKFLGLVCIADRMLEYPEIPKPR